LTHGDSAKGKEFEFEMSWISSTDTNNRHQSVPKDLLDDAETQAKKEDEDKEIGDAEYAVLPIETPLLKFQSILHSHKPE
jgi:hypothetical protein